MQAIVQEKYGSPDVLQLKEIEKPTPQDNQVLVKIHATAANPFDWHLMRAAPFFVRFSMGLRKPNFSILGIDIAGTVEAVGKDVTQFKPGDAVFGGIAPGGFAEYVATPAANLALKPANVSFEEAAATPCVGFTAIQGMRDFGKLQAGQQVLINGASGGIGTFAVQYAKSVGTEVTGVCSTRNLDLVRSIGADHVVDYTQEDFTRTGQQYDLLFDTVGNRSATDYRRALKPNGICSVAGFTTIRHMVIQVMFLGGRISRNSEQTIGAMGTARPNPDDLRVIQDLLATGKVKPVIDRCYPLRETADAIRYLETGRARGKVIVQIVPEA